MHIDSIVRCSRDLANLGTVPAHTWMLQRIQVFG